MAFLKYSLNSFSKPNVYDAYQFSNKVQNHCILLWKQVPTLEIYEEKLLMISVMKFKYRNI